MTNAKVSHSTWWLIEGPDDYRSGCFATRGEARFRLREMANEPWYYGDNKPVRQSDDFFTTESGATFKVVKL